MLRLTLIMLMLLTSQPALAGVVFYDDAEDAPLLNTDWYNNNISSPGYWVVSSEQARSGSKSYKVYKDPSQSRTELILWGLNAEGGKLQNFTFGETFWLGWSIYIPPGFSFPNNSISEWGLSGQFHAATEACDTFVGNGVPLSLFFNSSDGINGNFKLLCRSVTVACHTSYVATDAFVAYTDPLTPGWHDIVIQVRFGYLAQHNPFTKIWFDGALVVDDTDLNAFNDKLPPYFKWGIYSANNQGMTVYLDEFRVGREPCTYADVAPAGGSGVVVDPLAITTTTLGTLTQGIESTGTFAATGGSGHYIWSASGAPAGFTINSDGTWSITPEVFGDYSLSVMVSDAEQNTASKMFYGTIEPAAVPDIPVILEFTMPSTSNTLDVPVTSFIGDATVIAYMVTDNSSKPATGDARWLGIPVTSATAHTEGHILFYPHVMNSAGVVTTGYPVAVTIDVEDPVPVIPVLDEPILKLGSHPMSISQEG